MCISEGMWHNVCGERVYGPKYEAIELNLSLSLGGV